MSPLMSDANNDPAFWRVWNSRAAAYQQGGTMPQFGDFERQYNMYQLSQHLPLKEQLGLMQSGFEDQQKTLAYNRLLHNDQFEQAYKMQELKMQQEKAAREAAMEPHKRAADELKTLEGAYGHNPLEVLSAYEADPNAAKTGVVKLPGRYQYDPTMMKDVMVPGRDVQVNPSYISKLRKLRNQLVPQAGGNYDDRLARISQIESAMPGFDRTAQLENQINGSQPMGELKYPATMNLNMSPLSSDEQGELMALRAKKAAEMHAAQYGGRGMGVPASGF